LARTVYARDRAINVRVANSVSQEQLDQDQASMDEADARVKAFEKNMEVYKLNHEFTRVTSPIDGQVSRYYLTLGNLVNQDQTLLTTVVSLDPMYAYFDVDEPTLLRVRRAINEGRIKRRADGASIPVLMGLQGEDGFPHQGDHQLRQQPGRPDHGQHHDARSLREPRAAGRNPAALARDVRADPPADRPPPTRRSWSSTGPWRRTRG